MQAAFYRPDAPDRVVARARWTGSAVELSAEDVDVEPGLRRVFRATPVVAADPALLPAGASGSVVFHPGSLQWFRTAALQRSEAEGLRARLVPSSIGPGGWDPAGTYRPFSEQVRRREGSTTRSP